MQKETVLNGDAVLLGARNQMIEGKSLSEREIIEVVQKGDKEAYQEIVVRYMQSAYYVALAYVHNQQDALDISQDAFIRAFRRIKKFDTDKPFFPWFYKILKNLCIDYFKRRQRRSEVPLESVRILRRRTKIGK